MSTKGLTRREFLRIAGISGAGMIVAGCVPVGPAEPTAAPQATVASQATAAPTLAAAPQTGGVLKISLLQDAERLGYPPTMVSQNDQLFAHPAVENLVRFDESGAPAPWLATKWETDTKALTITLSIRKGVKFQDGTDLDAAAVKWNLENYQKTSGRAELNAVKSYDIVDDSTLRLNLARLDSLLIANLALTPGLIISPTAYQKASGTDKEKITWCEKNPVGTGAFRLTSWQKDVKIAYQKWDGYWQKGKPYLDGIEYAPIPDPLVQLAAFQKGDVHVLPGVDPKNAQELEASGKFKVAKLNVPSSLYALMGDSANPQSQYAKLEVRQAVWHAIDTETIVKTIGLGYWLPVNQAAPKGSWAYNPDVKGYPYDPAKAKQLLAQAGFPNGFKTNLYGQNVAPYPTVLTAIQGYLAAVGIDAKIDLMDQARFAKMVTGGATDGGWKDGLAMLPFTTTPNEFAPWNRLLAREVHAARFPSVYEPDEIMDLIAQGVAAPDTETLTAAVRKLLKADTDTYCMTIWLYAITSVNAKQQVVNDDGIQVRTHWNPQDAWLKKGA